MDARLAPVAVLVRLTTRSDPNGLVMSKLAGWALWARSTSEDAGTTLGLAKRCYARSYWMLPMAIEPADTGPLLVKRGSSEDSEARMDGWRRVGERDAASRDSRAHLRLKSVASTLR